MREIHLENTVILKTDARGAFPGSSFNREAAENAFRFHKSLPMYQRTELVSLDAAARQCGVKAILLKDESTRFGLKAFKGLGGSYAVFRILCDRLGLDHTKAVFRDFLTGESQKRCREVVFVTATDGNHGKGVAWASRLFGCKAHVYMPAGSAEARRKAIADAGAESAVITDLNYDQVVEYASRMAEEKGWILIQDTAWDGYETIPHWIIEGYLTMGEEVCEQLAGMIPTHVFLQAGVGAMAGLNCGTPCSITWPVIRDRAAFYCACTDAVSERAMRALAHPPEGSNAVVSGECGAVTFGAFLEIAKDEEARRALGIDEDSVILLFSTEGNTDPEGYARIVSEH